VPEGTVRWRHKLALERLRARLDERAGGDRRAWVASFGPLVGTPKSASLVAGGILVNKVVIGSVVAFITVAGGLVAWRASASHAAEPARSAASPVALSPASPPSAQAAPASPSLAIPRHAVQLPSVAERQRVVERIAAAQSAHQSAATKAPSLAAEDPPADLDKEVIRTAMREVLPFIQECYEAALPTLKSPDLDLHAHLVLTGDPDVGTLIDADKLNDGNGVALPAKLDDCLRSTFQTLELPPIGEGDRIDVDYPFVFRQAGEPTPPK
jgi:hypothetical protein